MAVTIHDTPQDFTPSDNPVIWTFSSDQTAQDNFVYLVKVYINDALVANEQVFPESGIYGRFDASGYTSNNCQSPQISSDIVIDANNYCKVKITVVERYGDPVADGASTAGTNIVAFKSRMTNEDFIDFTASDYIPTGGTDGAWVTNNPATPEVKRTDEQIRLLMINNELNVNIIFTLYDSDGVSIASDNYGLTATSFNLLIINATPSVIILETAITTANFTAASYYTVSSTTALMPEYRINLNDSCQYSTYKRLHFLSQFGSIESQSFGLISRLSGSINSQGYQQTFGEWSGSSFEFNKERGTSIDYAKSVERKLLCVSDWIPEAVQNFIAFNLKGSPLVYLENVTDGILERRRVTNKTLEYKIHENDVIFLEQVTIDLPSFNSMVL